MGFNKTVNSLVNSFAKSMPNTDDIPRKYQETHRWLTFELDLTAASHKLWMLLGEAQSKCDHVAGVPLLPEVEEELHSLYLAKGALATTAIEGNTLTEEQVRAQLRGQLHLPLSQQYLQQEVQNVIDACNELHPAVIDGTIELLTVDLIKKANEMVLKGLEPGEDVVPGEIRRHPVVVGNYRGAPAEDCEYLLGRLCETLNSLVEPDFPPAALGIIKAAFAHLYIAWIHPFGDGNGRTARLLEFIILLSHGVSTPVSHLLSNHYNQTRQEYYRQLAMASATHNPLPFLEYAVRGFIDNLKQQLSILRRYQLDLTWQRYVYDRFKDATLSADKRRRDLLLDFSDQEDSMVLMHQVTNVSPRTTRAYAKLSQRVVSRDLQRLESDGFISIRGGLVRARKELIKSFLPESKASLMERKNAAKTTPHKRKNR